MLFISDIYQKKFNKRPKEFCLTWSVENFKRTTMNRVILLAFSFCVCNALNVTNTIKYVFDYYKNLPPLDSEAIVDLLIAAKPGETFPLLHSVPTDTGFNCSDFKYPGYYADPSPPSFCQAFYRCEVNGNQMGFLCPNETLFNQLTLTCDYYFNVDCVG